MRRANSGAVRVSGETVPAHEALGELIVSLGVFRPLGKRLRKLVEDSSASGDAAAFGPLSTSVRARPR